MKHLSKLFMGFAAVALTACSSDEPAPKGEQNPDWNLGDEAYMTINIVDAEASRSIEDGGYEFGDPDDESKVYNAHFLFFDENEKFVFEADRWIDGGMNGTDKTQNIEHFGNNVLVIRNHNSTSTPKYLLTVLNAPADFVPVIGTQLKDIAMSLELQSTWEGEEEVNGVTKKVTHFVMSTTSYFAGTDTSDDTHNDAYYYVNVLSPKYFYKEPAPANITGINIVNVYVERLAAKVQLQLSNTLGETKDFGEGDEKFTAYKLPVTVSGNGNGAIGDATAATEVYVRFTGWGLNSTAKQTYLSKQLMPTWATEATEPFKEWNNAPDHRSFWAQGVAYDKAITNTVDDPYIHYVKAPELAHAVQTVSNLSGGNAAYCNEYTHKADDNIFTTVNEIINTVPQDVDRVIPAYTTSVVLRAVAYDQDGNILDLVLHGGVLFEKKDFLAYLLSTIGNDNLNFYVYDAIKDKYIQIDENYLALTSAEEGTGTVKVIANIPTGTKIYKQTTDENDAVKYVETTTATSDLNTILTNAQSASTWGESIAYTDGEMFYTIPIEHLNADKTPVADNDSQLNQKREGYYGVVRNHWYRITVDKLVQMGHGIFDPNEEPIIPDQPKNPTYYLGAKVNILSWKIVNQSAGI